MNLPPPPPDLRLSAEPLASGLSINKVFVLGTSVFVSTALALIIFVLAGGGGEGGVVLVGVVRPYRVERLRAPCDGTIQKLTKLEGHFIAARTVVASIKVPQASGFRGRRVGSSSASDGHRNGRCLEGNGGDSVTVREVVATSEGISLSPSVFALGDSVEAGDVLMYLAPVDAWIAEFAVPEAPIEITAQDKVVIHFALAGPERSRSFSSKITSVVRRDSSASSSPARILVAVPKSVFRDTTLRSAIDPASSVTASVEAKNLPLRQRLRGWLGALSARPSQS